MANINKYPIKRLTYGTTGEPVFVSDIEAAHANLNTMLKTLIGSDTTGGTVNQSSLFYIIYGFRNVLNSTPGKIPGGYVFMGGQIYRVDGEITLGKWLIPKSEATSKLYPRLFEDNETRELYREFVAVESNTQYANFPSITQANVEANRLNLHDLKRKTVEQRNLINSINQSIVNLNASIASINGNINTINGNINTINSTLSNQQNSIVTLQNNKVDKVSNGWVNCTLESGVTGTVKYKIDALGGVAISIDVVTTFTDAKLITSDLASVIQVVNFCYTHQTSGNQTPFNIFANENELYFDGLGSSSYTNLEVKTRLYIPFYGE
jgi:hypothetical protein